ncbi:MAG TPA: alpha-glucan family phosphorylase [Vicinamibacterales bacterium]|nr:alpha-glucan family phosphorylase [Vicinamibacterales bacterium]
METYVPLVPLPQRIGRLNELAYDLWWSWNAEAREVFRALDDQLWTFTSHNPVMLLHLLKAARVAEAAAEPAFLARYDAAIERFDAARSPADAWWGGRAAGTPPGVIAYFSAEFALHRSLPIYAGGLGVLAGDHLKEASDLGLPLVAVGLMYPKGYFHQDVTADGWQQEVYETLDWSDGPIEPAVTPAGTPCSITVPIGNRAVRIAVWRVRVGGVMLYLLDTDVDQNAAWDRELSARLYGGDRDGRLQQEIILGIGGVQALRALGIQPAVWHLNEGHAAFVSLQRIHETLAHGTPFAAALAMVRDSTVFTTHTPVPAGHDAFAFHLVEEHLTSCWGGLGRHRDAFLALGHYDSGAGPLFNMTALAMRTANAVNAVSELHGNVTRQMWAPMWPDLSESARPVRAITNGVHVPTWIAPGLASLFDRHLGADWRERQDDEPFWDAVLDIPDEEVWQIRCALRENLLSFIRDRAREGWSRAQVGAVRVLAGGTLLDRPTLTIGFARRFAEYKRSGLIFQDPRRLARILTHPRRPVQIVFAGKAHPADDGGKHNLQRVYRHAIDPAFGGRIAFVADYDLHVASFLVRGCDVWLNTPRKPLEASGTSGMKASINGGINLSIGDGWWAEGYTGSNGWLIDGGCTGDAGAMDDADAGALYRLLEEEVVPAFYERNAHDVPVRWVRLVKEAIRTVMPRFSARRMGKEYAERMYAPALDAAPVV